MTHVHLNVRLVRSLMTTESVAHRHEGQSRWTGWGSHEGMTHAGAPQFKFLTRHCALCPEGPYRASITPVALSAACKAQTYRSLRYLQLAVQCRRQANPFQTSIHTLDAGCFGTRVYEYACSRLVFRLDRAAALIRSFLGMRDRASTVTRLGQFSPSPTDQRHQTKNGDH